MKDSEYNRFREFNYFKEQNKGMRESYAPFEVRFVGENYKIGEDNGYVAGTRPDAGAQRAAERVPEQTPPPQGAAPREGPSADPAPPKAAPGTQAAPSAPPSPPKRRFSLKDRILESTAPLRTVVSAATCAAAAIVTASTVLTAAPKVTDIRLDCGNDYVSYSISVDDLDIDRSYMIEVSNPNFEYSDQIDVTEANDYNCLTGIISGLKPNYRYDFRLLKDNGEVGGYSTYYTKSFYTTKAPDPRATFEFQTEGNQVTVTGYLSDYYDLLSDAYLCATVDGVTSEYAFGDIFCTATVVSERNSPILFEVYATLYGEHTLIGSSRYTLTDIRSMCKDGRLLIYGKVGDAYRSIPDGTVDVVFYDDGGGEIGRGSAGVPLTADIDCAMALPDGCARYAYRIVGSTGVEIYESGVLGAVAPALTFGGQRLTADSLRLTVAGLPAQSAGYITDSAGNRIPLSFEGDTAVIPLYSADHERIVYASYRLFINGWEYEPAVDTGEIYLDGVRLVNLNGMLSVTYDTCVSLRVPMAPVRAEIRKNGNVLHTSVLSEAPQGMMYGECPILPDSVDIGFCLTDGNGNDAGGIFLVPDLPVRFMNLEVSVVNNVFTVSYRASDGDFSVEYNTDNGDLPFVLATEPEISDDGSYANGGEIELDSRAKKLTYAVYDGERLLYISPEIDLLNGSVLSQEISASGVSLRTDLSDIGEAYMLSDNDTRIDLTVSDGTVLLPLYSERGDQIHYREYTLYLSNDYASNTLTFVPEEMTLSENFTFENSYAANRTISFNAYVFTARSCLLRIELYENGVLAESTELENWRETVLYACNNMTSQVDTEVRIRFINRTDQTADQGEGTEETIGQSYTFTVSREAKIQTDYQASYPNPSDVLLTYNDDRTVNLYLGVDFRCEDSDMRLRITLSKFETDETLIYEFDPGTAVAVIEDLPDAAYGLEYTVYRQFGNLMRIYEDTVPSGGVNEPSGLNLTGQKETGNDGQSYFVIDVSDLTQSGYDNTVVPNVSFDAEKCFAAGHDNIVYDEQTETFRIAVENGETELVFTVYFGCSQIAAQIRTVTELDSNLAVKGQYGKYNSITFEL